MNTAFTYADAVDHALDYLGGTADDRALRDAGRAIQSAYRIVTNARTWSYLYQQHRFYTSVPYSTGTVAYDHTGGTYERMMVLSDGVWPDWAADGDVRIGVVSYRVAERIDDVTITLDAVLNPGVDIEFTTHVITAATNASPIVVTSATHGLATGARVVIVGVLGNTAANGTFTITKVSANTFSLDGSTGNAAYTSGGTWRSVPTTTYTLERDTFALPDDFVSCDTPVYEENYGGLSYLHPTDLMWGHRYIHGAGTPFYFCIAGDRRHPGQLVMRLYPYPSVAKSVDFIYERRPRPLVISEYRDGTVSGTGATTTVTGNGAAFTSGMVGSVLRLGTARLAPTALTGPSPALFETRILAVISPTTLRVADALDATYDAVRYVISDPVDIEVGAMLDAFLRGVERYLHLGRMIKSEDRVDAATAFDLALREAKAADSRSFQGRAIGQPRSRHLHPKYFPARFD